MALQIVRPEDVALGRLDLGTLQRANEQRQRQYNRTADVMNQQMQAIAANKTLDPMAKQVALQEQQLAYDRLHQKYQGNLAAGSADFMRQASQNLAHPFHAMNALQMEEFAKEREAALKYGDRAIVRSNVGAQKLYDPETGSFLQDQSKLRADVLQASDYTGEVMRVFSKMQADARAGRLKGSGIEGILERYNIEELSDDKIRELVNDPEFTKAFLATTTATVDNRPTVGYSEDVNPETGEVVASNMFTREASDPKAFNSGAAEFAYGILANRRYKKTSAQQIQDPTARLRARRNQDMEDMMRSMTTDRITDIRQAPEDVTQGLTFTNGELSDIQVPKRSEVPSWLKWSTALLGKPVEGAVQAVMDLDLNPLIGPAATLVSTGSRLYKASKSEKVKALRTRASQIKENVPEYKGATDEQVIKDLAGFERAMAATARPVHNVTEGYRAVQTERLRGNLPERTVSIDGVEFNLGNPKQAESFAEALGYSSVNDMLAEKENFEISELAPASGRAAITSEGYGKSTLGGGVLRAKVLDKNTNSPVMIEVSNDSQEVREAYRFINDLYQNVQLDRPATTSYTDPYNGTTSALTGFANYDASNPNQPVSQDILRTNPTFRYNGKVYTSGSSQANKALAEVLNAAKTYADKQRTIAESQGQSVSYRGLINSYLQNAGLNAQYMTWADMEQLAQSQTYSLGRIFAENAPTLRGSNQEEKL